MIYMLEKELSNFERQFKEFLTPDIDEYLQRFVFAKSKRLRPILGILFLKTLGFEVEEQHRNLFFAVELIHSASLLHDDIIDNAETRRGIKTVNFEYGNSLAVSSGDLLLALAMKQILQIENKDVQNMCVSEMAKICHGEISQFFSKYKTPTLDEYIEKSRQKTALLFKISITGAIMISKQNNLFELASTFAENFGIAFQIKNDLDNFISKKEDYQQGVYTAPVIFGGKMALEKTKDLINNYIEICTGLIKNLPENDYKYAILELVNQVKE